jgi:DNA-binding transcriptional LysR family regulator
MPETHLAQVDLNLLVALDALLAEGHVTRAAARLGLTQSALSRALGRLRVLLDDPLFVRTGHGMRPTPRAQALAEPLRRALEQLHSAVLDRPGFDPATSRRTFTLGTVDYALAVLLPPLLERLKEQAPGVDVTVRSIPRDFTGALEAGELDMVLMPSRPTSAGLVWTPLFDERFVCVLREGHPALRQPLTLKRFAALGHVLVAPEGRPGSQVDDILAEQGMKRRVALLVPNFLVVPPVVAASDLIATLPVRVVRAFEGALALQRVAPPLKVPGFTLAQGWHERQRREPGHVWFRGLMAEVGRHLAQASV